MRREVSLLWKVLVCVLLAGGMALAQITTGTISGTVSDSSGAVIPGANVIVRNVETGIERTVSSDAAGRYRAPQLGLGSYEVTVESAGFQTAVRSGITLTVGREATVDFTLQVGAVAERITVTGEAPLLETTTATVGGLVDEGTMRDLPLNGRSYADLTTLQPGVVSDMPVGNAKNAVYTGGGGAVRRSIGGTRPQQSTYLLDGIEITTSSEGMPVGSVLGQQLGVDAIREFTVLSNNFGAQYGRAAGGVVNAVTNSGTNEFHGTAFEFLRNEKLDARDYFLLPTQPKQPLKRNQFGGSLGGPIRKDHTFFFINYEGIRGSGGSPSIVGYATPETRKGCVTNAKGVCNPSARITPDPNITFFFDLTPLPTLQPNGGYNYRSGGTADFNWIPTYAASENYGLVRMDHQFSESDSLFGRFNKDESSRNEPDSPALLPEPFVNLQVGGYIVAAISETHVFSPTFLNILRIGFTRRNDHLFYSYTEGGEFFHNPPPGLDPRLSPVKGVPLGLFQIPTVASLGPSLVGPAVFIDNTYDYGDSLIINSGRHAITAGGGIKWFQLNELNEPWKYGQFRWLTVEDFLRNKTFRTIQVIGTSIPGLQVGDMYRGFRQTYGSLYIQDDLQALPSLTLNLGLRWEQISGPREVNGKLAVFKDPLRDKAATVLGKGEPMLEIRKALKGFSPRFGLAWTPFADRKTVLRGGFGVFQEMPMAYVWQLNIEHPDYAIRYQLNNPKFPYPFADPAVLQKATYEPYVAANQFKASYTMQWNLTLERQLGETFVVKANYVGMRGLNLTGMTNPNFKPVVQRDGRDYVEATAKVPNPNVSSFLYVDSSADQWYHAGQAVVEKRFQGGLRFNTSYTFSRNLDDATPGTKCAEIVGGTGNMTYYTHNLAAEKGLSPLHVKHNFILSYTYELPFGLGRRWGSQWKGVTDRVLGSWVISGSHSIRSGLPVNIQSTPLFSRCEGRCGAERPDLKPGGNNNPVLENWTPARYFDPTQFINPPALGFFGNVGRDTVIRPEMNNWNLSLTKDNRIGEGRNLEFRAEFFNFLNHPNFGSPGSNVIRDAAGNLDGNAGRITGTATSMRSIQFGLKLTF